MLEKYSTNKAEASQVKAKNLGSCSLFADFC